MSGQFLRCVELSKLGRSVHHHVRFRIDSGTETIFVYEERGVWRQCANYDVQIFSQEEQHVIILLQLS